MRKTVVIAAACAAGFGSLACVNFQLLQSGATPAAVRTASRTEAMLTSMVASATASSSSKEYVQAAVLPAATFAVGDSLSGGPDGKTYGVGLTANDISNSWTTCSKGCTLDFVFFVFTSKPESANVEFRVVSPSTTTVYQYTWSSKLDATNWYSAYAKGDYTEVGTYFAEVYVAGVLEGWAPVVFTKS